MARKRKWTAESVEQALDIEAVRTEAYMIGAEIDARKGVVAFEERLADLDEWFVDTVRQQIGQGEGEYEPEDITVSVQVVAGPGGYLSAGSPAYRQQPADVVLAEGAYEGEPEIYLPEDDDEFLRVGVEARLFDEDDETAPWGVHVMWTAYHRPEED